ncbi:hypothetical protein V502_05640, partial [Pseudogymnoascus sp. VKM F-4520 (FW-2644)]
MDRCPRLPSQSSEGSTRRPRDCECRVQSTRSTAPPTTPDPGTADSTTAPPTTHRPRVSQRRRRHAASAAPNIPFPDLEDPIAIGLERLISVVEIVASRIGGPQREEGREESDAAVKRRLEDLESKISAVDQNVATMLVMMVEQRHGHRGHTAQSFTGPAKGPTKELIKPSYVTLDIFYLAQFAAAIYRSSSQLTDAFPSPSDFPAFYATHHALLHPSAWRSYYSAAFLTQRITARFYRLPDFQDLPDSSSPLAQPRQRPPPGGGAYATKLPRWAHSVARTRRRQPSLPLETLTRLALSMLETTTARLRTAYPSAPPYSETQARFWLEHMKLGSPGPSGSTMEASKEAWEPNGFGVLVAQGALDVCAWEAQYSTLLWEASWAVREVEEPDLD